jgi:hypothetical protein
MVPFYGICDPESDGNKKSMRSLCGLSEEERYRPENVILVHCIGKEESILRVTMPALTKLTIKV